MQIGYRFKVGIYGKLSAEDAYNELQRIKEKSDDCELHPEDVVEASKDESSVLHGVFEWDDKAAADKWRIEQAKELIRNIEVVVTTQECTTSYRAIVSIVDCESQRRTWRTLPEVLDDDSARQNLLEQAKADAQTYLDKYSQLEELNNVKREMLKLIAGVYPEE